MERGIHAQRHGVQFARIHAKHAEQLVDSARRFGWTHSKRLGYDGPTAQERAQFFPALKPKHMVSMTSAPVLTELSMVRP